jgi:hypothetical protein
MEKPMMLANGEDKRKQGRPRKKLMDEIQEKTEMNLAELRDATMDRKRWKARKGVTMTVTRAQRVDNTR